MKALVPVLGALVFWLVLSGCAPNAAGQPLVVPLATATTVAVVKTAPPANTATNVPPTAVPATDTVTAPPPTKTDAPTVTALPTNPPAPTETATTAPTATLAPTETVAPTATDAPTIPPQPTAAEPTAEPTAAQPTAMPPTKAPLPTNAPPAAAAPFSVTWNKGFEYLSRDGNSFWCQMHNQVQNLTDQDMPFQSPDLKLENLLRRKPEGPLGGFQPIVGIANGDGSLAEWQLAGWYAKAFGWRNGIEEFPPHGLAAKGDTGDWTWYGVNQTGQYCKYVYVKWNGHTVAAEFSPQGELINANAVLPAGAP